MEVEQKERLARLGDMAKEVIAFRLRAARRSTGLGLDALAKDMGEGMTKQKLRNAEQADNYPSNALMRYYFRSHRIDFNFLIHGDFAQLPADVQARLFDALEAERSELDRKAGSDQSQDELRSEET